MAGNEGQAAACACCSWCDCSRARPVASVLLGGAHSACTYALLRSTVDSVNRVLVSRPAALILFWSPGACCVPRPAEAVAPTAGACQCGQRTDCAFLQVLQPERRALQCHRVPGPVAGAWHAHCGCARRPGLPGALCWPRRGLRLRLPSVLGLAAHHSLGNDIRPVTQFT